MPTFVNSDFLQLEDEDFSEVHWPQPCNLNNSHIWPPHLPFPFVYRSAYSVFTVQSHISPPPSLCREVQPVARKTVWRQHQRRRRIVVDGVLRLREFCLAQRRSVWESERVTLQTVGFTRGELPETSELEMYTLKGEVQHTFWKLLIKGSALQSAAKSSWIGMVGTGTTPSRQRNRRRLCLNWQKDWLHPISRRFQDVSLSSEPPRKRRVCSFFPQLHVHTNSRCTWQHRTVIAGCKKLDSVYVITRNAPHDIFHKSFLLQVPVLIKLSGSRCEAACGGRDVTHPGSPLLSALALWVMAGVPSCFRVSGWWWGNHPGHSGEDVKGQKQARTWERPRTRQRVFALLRVWAVQGSACIFVFLWRMVESEAPQRNPHRGSSHCDTKNISKKLASQFKDLSLLLICRTHDFTHLFTWWDMTHSLWVIAKKRVLCFMLWLWEVNGSL